MSVVASLLAWTVAMAGSEIVLAGTKLQTGLARVVGLYGLIGAAAAVVVVGALEGSLVAFGLYWTGAFLSWFGVRSHVESSILLRMLYSLRGGALSGHELVRRYDEHYGVERRVDELCRAGLAERRGQGIEVTRKGRWILAMVAWLQGGAPAAPAAEESRGR